MVERSLGEEERPDAANGLSIFGNSPGRCTVHGDAWPMCRTRVIAKSHPQCHRDNAAAATHLQNGVAQMMVDGQPYLMLAGELHNSSGSSTEYMQPTWDKLVALHLNTVIGTASWELVEPVEGTFDFSSVDSEIRGAENHGLHLVLIWFGSWKNANSSYAPIWVKRDPARFPRAAKKPGTASTSSFGDAADALSPFGEATVDEDAKAFRALMRHIKKTDAHHSVIMVQVENEVGVLGTSRDHSALAEAAWSKQVPAELMRYLVAHKGSLLPELSTVWGANGFKESGTWAEVFGTDAAADEVLMAWAFGHAVRRLLPQESRNCLSQST